MTILKGKGILFRVLICLTVFGLGSGMALPFTADLMESERVDLAAAGEYGVDPDRDAISAPPVPTNVNSSDGLFWDHIRTSWDESITATYYEIYRSTGNLQGPYDDFLGTTTDLYYDYPITANTVNWFAVWACNSVGCSSGGAYDPGGGYAEAAFDTVGYYHYAQKKFYLKLTPEDGWVNYKIVRFGGAGSDWIPIAGDWDGDGKDTVGLYNKVQHRWYLKNTLEDGWVNLTSFRFGGVPTDWIPVTGDWDGDGDDTVGFFVPDQDRWYLKNSHTDGWVDFITVKFGGASDADWQPVTGDWNMNGTDTVGVYVPSQNKWYLKNTHDPGWVDLTVLRFGGDATDLIALSGKWGST